MESNLIEKNQDQLTAATNSSTETVVKKVYAAPTITVHGKLSVLTNGGIGKSSESAKTPGS